MACRILVPRPRIEPASPALEGGFSITGPRGKSPSAFYTKILFYMVSIKRKISALLIKPRFVDGVLIETKVKGIKIERMETKVYKHWY